MKRIETEARQGLFGRDGASLGTVTSSEVIVGRLLGLGKVGNAILFASPGFYHRLKSALEDEHREAP